VRRRVCRSGSPSLHPRRCRRLCRSTSWMASRRRGSRSTVLRFAILWVACDPMFPTPRSIPLRASAGNTSNGLVAWRDRGLRADVYASRRSAERGVRTGRSHSRSRRDAAGGTLRQYELLVGRTDAAGSRCCWRGRTSLSTERFRRHPIRSVPLLRPLVEPGRESTIVDLVPYERSALRTAVAPFPMDATYTWEKMVLAVEMRQPRSRGYT